MRPEVPSLPGVLSARQVLDSAGSIAATQESSGAIPWYAGGHVDPWDHVQCAMACSVAGLVEPAVAAYRYLAGAQRRDGSWPARVVGGVVEDVAAETNQCSYLAVGLWHHWCVTGDRALLQELWATVRSALDFVVAHASTRGEIAWRVTPGVGVDRDALLTGSSSTYHALRCGLALADLVGDPQPEWEIAAGRLGHVVARHPEAFLDKGRYSMDWYYPVLGGALRGAAADARIDAGWRVFVRPELGVRCVSDQPWVTGAETCELVLTLDCLGRRGDAVRLLGDVQHLREPDGSYWTGYQYAEDVRWPDEHSTWTAATVVLAVDALSGTTGGSGIFRAERLPTGTDLDPSHDCGCDLAGVTA